MKSINTTILCIYFNKQICYTGYTEFMLYNN